MKETTPKLLQIPEIALSIIINLDPSTLLSIRLVSLPINTLIQSAGQSLSATSQLTLIGVLPT